MEKIRNRWILLGLAAAFIVRYFLSLTIYNADIHNHVAWMESVKERGWQGLYERDMEPRADVNYPPFTLYTFWIGEKTYEVLPASWQTEKAHASLYKVPSLLADILVAWLIWRYTKFKVGTKVFMMAAYLINPGLAYNSIYWGQIEALVSFFCIFSLILFSRGKPAEALIAFTVAVLSKQNALPLVPVVALGLYLTRPHWKKVVGGVLVSLSIFFLSYIPLVPRDASLMAYPVKNYLSTIGGQPHQWQSTVNALNFWYWKGQNYAQDSTAVGPLTARQTGLILTLVGTVIGLAAGYRYRKDKYQALFLAASIISLWTFSFATRMHERHNYMMIAYLTLLLPTMRRKWPYIILSAISYYNLYAVWQEYFYYNWGVESWLSWTGFLSAATVVLTLIFPVWLSRRKAK